MIKRSIAAWVAVCLISGMLLYAEQIRRQYWERDREFTARYSAIGAVLTQNESVLPLLSGDEDITALRKKFPSVLALEKPRGVRWTPRVWSRFAGCSTGYIIPGGRYACWST